MSKPCPFCGGKAAMYTLNDHGDYSGPDEYYIVCLNDAACGAETNHYLSSGAALSAWNRRTSTEIQKLQEQLHIKNRVLDALYYVWCSGGCDEGVLKWYKDDITEEIVMEAERNTKRLRTWWDNHVYQKEHDE